MKMIYEHTKEEEKDFLELMLHDFHRDQEFGKELLMYYYAHKEIGELLLHCSIGSSYENFVDRLVDFMEERNHKTIGAMGQVAENSIFNECTQHWFSHMMVDAFLHVLSHDFTEERALQQIDIIVTFMHGGFNALLEKTKK